MTRVVLPSKLDSRLHKNLAPDLEDGFGWFIANGMFFIGAGGVGIILAVNFSLLFLLFFLAPTAMALTGRSLYKHTLEVSDYKSDRSLYAKAYAEILAIQEPNTYEDAKTLASNIWEHQKAITELGKPHHDSDDCSGCAKRVQLITRLRIAQPLPSFDGSDIERIEAKLAARKELGV